MSRRIVQWAAPVVAFGLILALAGALARAEDKDTKKETGSVSGKVTDKDGKAVSGVQVSLFHPMNRKSETAAKESKSTRLAEKGEKPAKGDKPVAVATATSDADGKYTLSDVPVGDYLVVARQKGVGNAREKVTVKAGETASVDLKLEYKSGGKGGEKPAPAAEK